MIPRGAAAAVRVQAGKLESEQHPQVRAGGERGERIAVYADQSLQLLREDDGMLHADLTVEIENTGWVTRPDNVRNRGPAVRKAGDGRRETLDP